VCHDFLAKNVGFLVLVPNLLPKYGHFFTWKGGEGPESTAASGFLNARRARHPGPEGEGLARCGIPTPVASLDLPRVDI
jgi:hypothetical protein